MSRKEKNKTILFLLFLFFLLINPYLFGEDDIYQILKKPSYVYNPDGKPDPFEPFFIKEESFKGISPEELRKLKLIPSLKTELQRIKLEDLRIVAVVKMGHKVIAMVEGPDGKGYILKPGMGIGMKGGVVDKIIFKEEMTPFGRKLIKKVIIKEPFLKNGKICFRYIDLSMEQKNE